MQPAGRGAGTDDEVVCSEMLRVRAPTHAPLGAASSGVLAKLCRESLLADGLEEGANQQHSGHHRLLFSMEQTVHVVGLHQRRVGRQAC